MEAVRRQRYFAAAGEDWPASCGIAERGVERCHRARPQNGMLSLSAASMACVELSALDLRSRGGWRSANTPSAMIVRDIFCSPSLAR